MTAARDVRFTLDALPCAAARTDSRLNITAANSAFRRLWASAGSDAALVRGAALASLFPSGQRAHLRGVTRGGMAPHSPRAFSVSLPKTKLSVELAPLSDARGRGWLVMLRERATVAARPRRTEPDDATLTMSVVHDLKMPLQAVLGWVSLLRKERVDPVRLHHVLTIVERNTQLQVELLNKLLHSTRSPAGEAAPRFAPCDLSELVRATADGLRAVAAERHVVLSTVEAQEPVVLWGDKVGLTRMVSNLMVNAIKFSEPGGAVECRTGLDGRSARLMVSDRGKGISPELLPHVFDAFRRGASACHGTDDGVGLGLAVVRQIATQHRGQCRAESDGEGRGARFTVTLPRTPVRETVTNDLSRVRRRVAS